LKVIYNTVALPEMYHAEVAQTDLHFCVQRKIGD